VQFLNINWGIEKENIMKHLTKLYNKFRACSTLRKCDIVGKILFICAAIYTMNVYFIMAVLAYEAIFVLYLDKYIWKDEKVIDADKEIE